MENTTDSNGVVSDALVRRLTELLLVNNATGISAQQIADVVRKEMPEELAILAYHTGDGGREWQSCSSWLHRGEYIALMASPNTKSSATPNNGH